MNPNVMAPAAPQKLMQDVMPPNAHPVIQAAMQTPQPLAQPEVQQAPQAEVPTAQPAPVAETVSVPAQPMFPVHEQAAQEPSYMATPQVPESTAEPVAFAPQAPEMPMAQPSAPHQAQTMPHKPKTNWLVIGLAIVVSAGLAVAAYMAFKTA